MDAIDTAEPVSARLVKAALDCFLADDCHRVATRLIADILRLPFVSPAMTPMLLKDIFEEQMERPMDAAFPERLAAFNGHLFSAGLAPDAAA